MADISNVHESPLCDKCSVLRFNDKELGGRKAQSHDGQEILSFTDGNNPYEPCRELWLDYIHRDSLPELPCLKASAEAGCAFCAILRSTALELGFTRPVQVTFKLCYLWYPRTIPQYGLCTLVARWQSEHIEFGTLSNHTFVFYVDCDEGDSQPDNSKVLTDRIRRLSEMAENSTCPTDATIM